ncbi:hypothetical protein GDO81_004389 [Engystomops pustulosus]|uniref:Uncharacterized protein n=1 Tax=Engystomops pustulosus TaxID=76066 RepID=A0AAV6ZRZ4_ENGPU|nr:hypothetical protein GDO81_004389 [Engystomops pustulosus]
MTSLLDPRDSLQTRRCCRVISKGTSSRQFSTTRVDSSSPPEQTVTSPPAGLTQTPWKKGIDELRTKTDTI